MRIDSSIFISALIGTFKIPNIATMIFRNLLLNYIHWDVNPLIFPESNIHLRWYGLIFASGLLLAYMVGWYMFKKEGVSLKKLDNVTFYSGLMGIIGARIGHCLFYQPEYYLPNPIEILKIWEGGLASHGGVIGVLLALLILSYHQKVNLLWLLDRYGIAIPLAGAFIRIGNLMNSEILGVVSDKPWAFIFVNGHVQNPMDPRHPAQLYEAFAYLLIFVIAFSLYRFTNLKNRKGFFVGLFFALTFLARFLIEFIKEDQVSKESGMSMNIGQQLSIPFIILGIGLIVYSLITRKRIEQVETVENM